MEKKKIIFSPPRKRTRAFSTMDIKKKRPCYKSNQDQKSKINENLYSEYYFEPDGPIVITHLQKKVKHEHKKSKPNALRYQYFSDHKDCPETLLYTCDLLHPKILRHHSKDKNKTKKPSSNIIQSKCLTSVVSTSIRETNQFNVFMNQVKKNKIVI
jgi:hypothetical protein